MTLPDLPVVVHLQMLACLLMSPSITSELFFLLSSQGGYTMAYCQKEVKWSRAHTQVVLYFEGVAVPIADLQLPVLWFTWPPWLKYQGVELVVPPVFLGLPLAVKTRKEDRFSILRCLSCDQVGKRCRSAGTQNSRLFLLINWC